MSDEIQSFKQVIDKSFGSIHFDDMRQAVSLYDSWKAVLQKIKSEKNPSTGQNLASHSRVVDLKNGVLLVEADHPGWIELLQLYKQFILTGLKKAEKDIKIETIAFKLAGKGARLYDSSQSSAKEVKEEIEKRIFEEEKLLKEAQNEYSLQKISTQKELPKDLAVIFEDLRKSMLTNSKK